jgi:hypothetical protein
MHSHRNIPDVAHDKSELREMRALDFRHRATGHPPVETGHRGPVFLVRLLLVAVLAVAAAAQAVAFSADGHRIVAELAERRLSGDARAAVNGLLAGTAEDSLADVATWPDDVRELPDYNWSARLHYVNFPRDAGCRYRARRDCPDGGCVIGAIERYARTLGDRRRAVAERREALKFLVHFVGDIHQPLHAGYADDRGGNLFQIYYLGRGSNLHSLWDGGILRQSRLDWRAYADRLDVRRAEGDSRWSTRAPQRWAEASCRLLGEAQVYPRRPGKLPAGYAEKQLPVVESQIVRAGARLAALLNAVLASSD